MRLEGRLEEHRHIAKLEGERFETLGLALQDRAELDDPIHERRMMCVLLRHLVERVIHELGPTPEELLDELVLVRDVEGQGLCEVASNLPGRLRDVLVAR